MLDEHSHKAAVVAGGSAGVGRAVARALAARGYAVAVLARGEARLADAETELGDEIPALAIACDVSDAAAVDAAAERVEAELGPIAVWVNSAMLTSFSPFDEVPPEEFARIVDVTLIGAVNGTRAALKRMRPRKTGRIVNVGSGLAYRSVPLQSAYCAAKHGLRGFTASLRSELIHEGTGVTVSMVQLPAVNTPQFDWARNRLDETPQPAPPIFAPEVAARGVMRAVGSGEREVFVGKSAIALAFGDMVAPDYLDRRMARDAVAAQKSGEPAAGDRPGNLDAPATLDGDAPVAATGSFSGRARESGAILGGGTARIAVFGGAGLALAAAGALVGAAL
jgi:NAD(P)-dependent dehydrogenase (short-subunit alcohol dehydrogenase family)